VSQSEWHLAQDGDATAVRPDAFSLAQPFDQEGKPILRERVTRDDTCPAT
jgi:hypothetical protein